MRLISADKLISDWTALKKGDPGNCYNADEVIDSIREAETCNDENQIHADWYRIETGFGTYIYSCTQCKNVSRTRSNYCPMCGATMDGKENSLWNRKSS